MSTSATIRSCEPGDREQVIALYNLCFDRPRETAEWEWHYDRNPAGPSTTVVAEDGGRIVGYAAFIPSQYKVENQLLTGGLYADCMVHPDYRGGPPGERVSARLLETLYVQAREYDFVYGTPNTRSLGLARRPTGAGEFGAIPLLARLINPLYLLGPVGGKIRRASRRGTISKAIILPASVCKVDVADGRFDRLWETVRGHYRVIGVRDAAYVQWRFLDTPPTEKEQAYHIYTKESQSQLDGYIALRVWDEGLWRVGYLVDMLTSPDDTQTIRQLATVAMAHCRAAGADLIRCWMRETFPAYRVLRAMGFRPRALDWGWRVRLLSPSAQPSPLLDPTAWYFTLGDCDGV